MKYLFVPLVLFVTACGMSGEQKFTVRDSYHTIGIEFKFLQQIKDLCTAQTIRTDYSSVELYNKAIADCTFRNLTLVSVTQLQTFLTNGCSPDANLSHLTPEQLENVQFFCGLLEGM